MKRLIYTISLIISISLAISAKEKVKLVILHTNDTHSQVEPTALSGLKTSNMGGYARRMGVIKKIRSEEENVLLLDAGDFSQGTPYFNFYNGRVEIDAMNRMKYDAVTLGNHEFDNGIDTLATVLKDAEFPLLSSNYNVENTPLKGMVEPYLVIEKSGIRIGVLALGVNPKSLIIKNNYKGLEFLDPYEKANEIAAILKEEKQCDVIICISHLGANQKKMYVNDFEVARKSKYIDLILGGHSHSLIENEFVENVVGKEVCIAQMGKRGFFVGRVDIELEQQ